MPTVPTGILTIDYGNPLATGLVGVYVPGGVNGGSNLVDPGNGDVALYGTAVDNVSGVEGLGMQATGGGMAGTCSAAQTTALTASTLYWRGQPVSDEDGDCNLVGPDAKANYAAPDRDGWSIRCHTFFADGFQAVWNDGHSNVTTLAIAGGMANGVAASVAATFLVGGNVIGYRDGAFVSSVAFSGAFSDPPAFDPTARMQIGATDNFNRDSNGITYVAYMWNRVLDATEMATLDANPYAFLVAPGAAVATGSAFSTPQLDGQVIGRMVGY